MYWELTFIWLQVFGLLLLFALAMIAVIFGLIALFDMLFETDLLGKVKRFLFKYEELN